MWAFVMQNHITQWRLVKWNNWKLNHKTKQWEEQHLSAECWCSVPCEEPFEFYTMRSGLWAEVNLGHLRDYFISASLCKMKHARADGWATQASQELQRYLWRMHYINKAPVGAFVCVSNTAHTLRSSPSHTRPLVVTWWLQPTPLWRRSWGWVTHWMVGPPSTSHRQRHSLCDNSLYWSEINTWDRLTSAEPKGLYFQKDSSEVKLNLAKRRTKRHSCHGQDPKKSNPTTIIYSICYTVVPEWVLKQGDTQQNDVVNKINNGSVQ